MISSMAKSLPHPPTPLFFIFRTTEVWFVVVNTNPYCSQFGVGVPAISPVFPDCKSTVSVLFHISKLILIGIPLPGQPPEAEL